MGIKSLFMTALAFMAVVCTVKAVPPQADGNGKFGKGVVTPQPAPLSAAMAADGAEDTHDLCVMAVTSPRACVLTTQPVALTVRNWGDATVTSFTVGVIRNGEPLFEEQVEAEVAKWQNRDVVLAHTLDMDYGKTDVVKVYVRTDGTDTNAVNDTGTVNVTMPEMTPYPYSWKVETAEGDFTANRWNYDSVLGRFYITGRGSNWYGNTLVTPGVDFAADSNVSCGFSYHAGSSDVTLYVIADYGASRDTVFSGLLPPTPGSGMEPFSVSFRARGTAQIIFSAATNPMAYDELVLSDITLSDAVPDLAARAVLQPAIRNLARREEGYAVRVRYANNSPFDITDPLFCYEAGGVRVAETYKGVIGGGETVEYTFAKSMDTAGEAGCTLTAWCEADGDGKARNDTVTADFTFYDAVPFPYSSDFDTGLDLWSVYDGDGDGSGWGFDALSGTGGCALLSPGASLSPDDWLITPAVRMPAGRSRISFYYSGMTGAGTKRLEVLAGDTPDPSEMTDVLFDVSLLNNGWLNGFHLIDMAAAADRYFAFRATGTGDRVYIDNLRIDSGEDLCINDVVFDTSSGFNKTVANVSLSFVNHGVTAQKDVAVRYLVNSVPSAEEVVAVTVEPGDTVRHTFAVPVDISVPDSSYTLVGEIVTEVGADRNNDRILGQTLSHWANRRIPYYNGFDDTERNAQWTAYRTAGDGQPSWGPLAAYTNAYSDTYTLGHSGVVPEGAADWAWSECIEIPAGRYEFSFFYRTNVNQKGDRYAQSFGVSLGTDRNPESMTAEIVSFEDVLVSSPFYRKFTGIVDVPADGRYYLGFRNTSSACEAWANTYIDDVEIKEAAAGRGLPFKAVFADGDGGWTKYNTKVSNPHWELFDDADEGVAVERVERTQTHAILSIGFEDKLVSPKLRLEPDRKVVVAVDYALSSDSVNTAIDMFMGPVDNPDSLVLVASMPVVPGSVYARFEHTFNTGDVAEDRFIGFRTNSPVEMTANYCYDARIKSVEVFYDVTSRIGTAVSPGVSMSVSGNGLRVVAEKPLRSVDIYDMRGRKVMGVVTCSRDFTIDCSGLSGVYVVRAAGEDAETVMKFVF